MMCYAVSVAFHQSLAAGVCFYQKESLPGYSAIFKHPDEELNFCYYLIPYGKEGYCGDVKVTALMPAAAQHIKPQHA